MILSHQLLVSNTTDASPCSEFDNFEGTFSWNTEPSSIQRLSNARAFADTGGMTSGDELAQRVFNTASNAVDASALKATSLVASWIDSRAVVTVLGLHGWMLPMFQFDLATSTIKPSMRPVLAELRGVFEDVELALWFVSSNNWLEGERPAIAMDKNLPSVLHAARADRFVARGH